MTGPRHATEAPGPQDASGTLQTRLAFWRSEGAHRIDPVRFHYLEALSRRIADQPEPVRQLLQDKLQTALADYAQRVEQAHQGAADEAARLAPRHPTLARELRRLRASGDVRGLRQLAARAEAVTACEPLAQLNAHIRAASPASAAAAAPGMTQERPELASARRFRRSWSMSRTQDQVTQAATRKPTNAGPLNSHALVLQTLDLVRELSPHYLQHLLVQVESLQWLDQARELYPRKQGKTSKAAAKPVKRGRGAK